MTIVDRAPDIAVGEFNLIAAGEGYSLHAAAVDGQAWVYPRLAESEWAAGETFRLAADLQRAALEVFTRNNAGNATELAQRAAEAAAAAAELAGLLADLHVLEESREVTLAVRRSDGRRVAIVWGWIWLPSVGEIDVVRVTTDGEFLGLRDRPAKGAGVEIGTVRAFETSLGGRKAPKRHHLHEHVGRFVSAFEIGRAVVCEEVPGA